jgi:hypothetical protein
MKKHILVKVTKEHIKKGLQGNCSRCPIALALRDVTGSDCVVGGITATLKDLGICYVYYLSEPARNFVYNFDKDRKVKPATFRIKLHDTN